MNLLLLALGAALLSPSESGRLGEGSLNAPSALKAHVHDSFGDFNGLSPFGKAFSLTVPFDDSVEAGVSSLFDASLPSTVGGFIVSVIVDSSDAVGSRGFFSHVSKEVEEGLSPSLAYRNSATAPVSIPVGFGVFASLNHLGPAVIGGGSKEPMPNVFGFSNHNHEYNKARGGMEGGSL